MTDKQPAKHAAWGCTCAVCTEWRQNIYNSGRWPRPRYYNGDFLAPKAANKADTSA